MFDLFAFLIVLVSGAVGAVSNSMAIVDREVVANKNLSSSNHKLIELEKQKESILSLSKYKSELYLGMLKDYLAKIDSDGKITEVSLGKVADFDKYITLLKEFNGNLYLVNTSKDTAVLLKMEPNGEVTEVLENGDGYFINSLEVFNDKLYIAVSSADGLNNEILKMDSNGKFSLVLNFSDQFLPSELKTFNNHLYFVIKNVSNGNVEIKTLSSNGKVKKVTEMENNVSTLHLTEFKDELYFSLYNGSLYKISTSDEVKEVVKRKTYPNTNSLVVFQKELYLDSLNKLEKLTKDNEIEIVVETSKPILSLAEFNGALYIGMVDGYFAKLT